MATEISKSDLLEYPRNVAGDVLSIRSLKFTNLTTGTSGASTITRTGFCGTTLKIGDIIEVKHPTDYTKYEVKTITNVVGDVITVNGTFANTYPAGSFLYLYLGERDVIDSLITDRTPVSVLFVEQAFKELD